MTKSEDETLMLLTLELCHQFFLLIIRHLTCVIIETNMSLAVVV